VRGRLHPQARLHSFVEITDRWDRHLANSVVIDCKVINDDCIRNAERLPAYARSLLFRILRCIHRLQLREDLVRIEFIGLVFLGGIIMQRLFRRGFVDRQEA
jgi:hypothetical protein